jgi:DNA-directed RNA polymerase specialized sigma24 family protein
MSISCTRGQLYTITSAGRQASDTSDLDLIRSIAARDKQAMQILFARHNVRVFRFLARFVGDKSAAEDLVSEVFLDVWLQAGRFQDRSQVTTWLLAIARNKALSALPRRSTEELDEKAVAAVEDTDNNPARRGNHSMDPAMKAGIGATACSVLIVALVLLAMHVLPVSIG